MEGHGQGTRKIDIPSLIAALSQFIAFLRRKTATLKINVLFLTKKYTPIACACTMQ